MREQRESRERDRTHRFLDDVSMRAAELAEKLGWERILVSGGERWTEPLISRFPQSLRDKVVADPRFLHSLDDTALAAAVTEQLHKQHKDREKQLLAHVRDAAGSGLAALGLSEVAAALNAGRVAHLVYDPQVRYTGSVGVDDALYGGDEIAPGEQLSGAGLYVVERWWLRSTRSQNRWSAVVPSWQRSSLRFPPLDSDRGEAATVGAAGASAE